MDESFTHSREEEKKFVLTLIANISNCLVASRGEQSVIIFERVRKSKAEDGTVDLPAPARELALRDHAEGKPADLLRDGTECKSMLTMMAFSIFKRRG